MWVEAAVGYRSVGQVFDRPASMVGEQLDLSSRLLLERFGMEAIRHRHHGLDGARLVHPCQHLDERFALTCSFSAVYTNVGTGVVDDDGASANSDQSE